MYSYYAELLTKEYEKILSNKNINFEKEYYFDDLLGDFDNLRFDFAVFDDFNNLKFLIESGDVYVCVQKMSFFNQSL